MKIENQIKEILLLHGSVQFTGIGTLEKVRREAKVEEGTFNPPVFFLKFSGNESVDEDEYFIKILAETQEISEDTARQSIQEYTDAIRFAFNKGENFEIKGVCTLFQDENNTIRVDKDPGFVLDPENFGLESFELDGDVQKNGSDLSDDSGLEKIELNVDMDQDMSKFEETFVLGKTEEAPVSPQEDNGSSEGIPDFEIPEDYRGGNRLILWIVSGAAAVIATIFVIYQMDLLNKGKRGSEAGNGQLIQEKEQAEGTREERSDEDLEFDQMVEELIEEEDSSSQMQNALDPDKPESMLTREDLSDSEIVQDEEKQTQTLTEQTAVATKAYKEYHIICGSFRDISNARELQQNLTMQGYSSLILEPGNGIYRVSAGAYRNKAKALDELVKFRASTGMESAWLMNLN